MLLDFRVFTVIVTVFTKQVCSFVTPLFLQRSLSSESAKLQDLYVRCDKAGLFVSLRFDQAFGGTVYSLGHNSVPECGYVSAANNGQPSYEFLIPVNKCGTEGQYRDPKPGEKVSIRNTIIVQHDIDLITAEDSAHALSCTWSDSYLKPITVKPIQVEDSSVIPVTLKSSENGAKRQDLFDPQYAIASGLIQDGSSEKSVLITVMDPYSQYDATILDCLALDRSDSSAVALTDKNGCMLQLKVMPPFKKTRDAGIGLILTSTIKDPKLATNKNIAIKCNIQVCPGQCPTPCQFADAKSKQLLKEPRRDQ